MKASFPSPIYQSGADRYEIDTCAPQMKALREGKIEMHALSKGHYPGKRMNSNILPGLTNVGFWNCRGAQDWGLDFHRNEGLEIVFLETGGMGFEVDGRTHLLHAGNLTITRPWQMHKLGDPHIGRGRLCWLILDVGVRRPNQEWSWPSWVVLAPRDLAELTRKLRHGEQSVWMANPRMREVFRDLADCVLRWKEPGVTSRLAVAVNRLLVELLDVLAEQQTRGIAGSGDAAADGGVVSQGSRGKPGQQRGTVDAGVDGETMRHGHHRDGEVLPGTREQRPDRLFESLPPGTRRPRAAGKAGRFRDGNRDVGGLQFQPVFRDDLPETLSDDAHGLPDRRETVIRPLSRCRVFSECPPVPRPWFPAP